MNRFGYEVVISGNRVVIGAPLNNHDFPYAGAAYVFEHNGTGWTEEVKLTASDAASSAFLEDTLGDSLHL